MNREETPYSFGANMRIDLDKYPTIRDNLYYEFFHGSLTHLTREEMKVLLTKDGAIFPKEKWTDSLTPFFYKDAAPYVRFKSKKHFTLFLMKWG